MASLCNLESSIIRFFLFFIRKEAQEIHKGELPETVERRKAYLTKNSHYTIKILDSLIVEGRPHPGIITSPLVPPSFDTCQEAQMVKNLPAMQVTQFRSLGQGDPLEKGMAIHSSSLAWRIP